MIKANIKLGATAILVEADDTKELFKQSGFFAALPQCCGKCSSKNIAPAHSHVKGFDFYFLKCLEPSCGFEFKLGVRKEDGGLFPKTEEGWVAPYSKASETTGDEFD